MPDEEAIADPIVADETPVIDYGPDGKQPEEPQSEGARAEDVGSEPEASGDGEGEGEEEPPPKPETRPQLSVEDYTRMVAANPNRINEVPARLRGQVFAAVSDQRAQAVLEQARAQARAERELETKFTDYETAWKDADVDALNELADADPHTASQWFFARAQQLYQKSPQAQQQQVGQQAQSQMAQRVQSTYATLPEGSPEKAEVDAWLDARPNPRHIDPTDEALFEFRDIVTAAKVRHERGQELQPEEPEPTPRRRPLRPNVSGGTTGGGQSGVESYQKVLKDGAPLPSAEAIDRLTAAYSR